MGQLALGSNLSSARLTMALSPKVKMGIYRAAVSEHRFLQDVLQDIHAQTSATETSFPVSSVVDKEEK